VKSKKISSKDSLFPSSFHRLRDQLGQVQWIAQGTVLERNKPGQGGPRYQSSRRVEVKTVTVALSAEQFTWLGNAIADRREVGEIPTQTQKLTNHAIHVEKHPRHNASQTPHQENPKS